MALFVYLFVCSFVYLCIHPFVFHLCIYMLMYLYFCFFAVRQGLILTEDAHQNPKEYAHELANYVSIMILKRR